MKEDNAIRVIEEKTVPGFTKYAPGAGFAAEVRTMQGFHEMCSQTGEDFFIV